MKNLLLIALLMLAVPVQAEVMVTGQIMARKNQPTFLVTQKGNYGFQFGGVSATFNKFYEIANRECRKSPCQFRCEIETVRGAVTIRGIIKHIYEIVKL